MPPQEEGLFSNSWNGKFHLEVHPLHAAHWAQWDRPGAARAQPRLVRRPSRRRAGDRARAPRRRRVVDQDGGSRRPQQPLDGQPLHHVAAAGPDLPGRAGLSRASGRRDARALTAVWSTRPRSCSRAGRAGTRPAGASCSGRRSSRSRRTTHRSPPRTPAFELEFFRWGLETAQRWRERRGLPRDPVWDRVIAGLGAGARARRALPSGRERTRFLAPSPPRTTDAAATRSPRPAAIAIIPRS